MVELSVKKRIYYQLNQDTSEAHLSFFNKVICSAIFLMLAVATLRTEQSLPIFMETVFFLSEIVITLIFTLEYGARFWCCDINELHRGLRGRVIFFFSPLNMADFFVVLLSCLLFFVGKDNSHVEFILVFLRILRIFRIIRFFAILKRATGVKIFLQVVRQCRSELFLSFIFLISWAYFCAVIMWFVEKDIQPDAFASIPKALWWSFITITTVGYGDVYAVTALGRVLTFVTVIGGIGAIALPGSVIAATFIVAYRDINRKRQKH